MGLFWLCFIVLLGSTLTDAKRRVMPWMCLERCGATSKQIEQHLKQIHDHRHTLSAVAFELFNLGPNSTLITNNFYRVIPALKNDKLETIAMISSYPYPPEFLDWLRALWANPEPFYQQCTAAAKKYGFGGYNVDFEPTTNATPQDAKDYAKFLDDFAQRMHKEHIKVTVDVANWNPLWDWTLIGRTAVDRVMLMSTYTGNMTLWEPLFKKAVASIPLHKLGIGLMNPEKAEALVPFTDKELQIRFDFIRQAKITEVDIWKSPIEANWWPFLEDFVNH